MPSFVVSNKLIKNKIELNKWYCQLWINSWVHVFVSRVTSTFPLVTAKKVQELQPKSITLANQAQKPLDHMVVSILDYGLL